MLYYIQVLIHSISVNVHAQEDLETQHTIAFPRLAWLFLLLV